MATSAEHLILRGLHLLIRTTFSPNDPVASAKAFKGIQDDIGPWLRDYADEMEKPAIDWSVDFKKAVDDGGGGLQQ
jgi:hypothetical protein